MAQGVLVRQPTPVPIGKVLGRAVRPIVTIVAVLALWEVLVRVLAIPVFVLPTPSMVADSTVANAGQLVRHFWITALESVLGFLLGNGVAVGLAILFVYNKTIQRSFYPFAIAIRTVPIIAITPILVLMFGSGMAPKVAIAALISFFPTLVNMVRGLEAVEPAALELMHVLSANKLKVFLKLRVPSSLPFLFSALRIASTSSVLGAIIAEWIGSDMGIGYLIIIATYQYKSSLLYSAMLIGSLFATLFFVSIGLIERRVVPWKDEVTVGE